MITYLEYCFRERRLSTKIKPISSSAVTVTEKIHKVPSVLFAWWSFDTAAGCLSAPLVSIHYSLSTSASAALENNLHSVLADDSLQRKPAPTHTHTDTPSQTNTTTPRTPGVNLINMLQSEGIPCKTAAGRAMVGRKRERIWVAGVSDLFLCGGTDWKLLHTTTASNPGQAQLFWAGSMWWGATRARFTGVETNKHRGALNR